ncbi:uncharacterized protein PF3D7_1120000-like [Biomphalaria glabrata]|uniref:Uncharacterized protein PF3D7_1120000-like n=2 Tax=Biomphalaria glabrata TaxID=6526 RepID=A0A9W2YKY2_BIOGL|nr:uncharacterized protein PF3D7_1120000-like [Biomphalaria glabrata]
MAFLLSLLLGIYLAPLALSDLIINVQPEVISPVFTSQLVINCSVTNNQVSNIDVIKSVSLSRYNETIKDFYVLLSLDTQTFNLQKFVQFRHAQVSFGNLFLSLTVYNPVQFDAQAYRCNVDGDNSIQKNVSMKAKKEVRYEPNVTALIQEITRLKISEEIEKCSLNNVRLSGNNNIRSKLHFVGDSEFVKELIEPLTLRCSFLASNENAHQDSAVQFMYILHETNGVIATISRDQPAPTTSQKLNSVTLQGELNKNISENSYIRLSWRNAKVSDSGKYFCGAHVNNVNGQRDMFQKELLVSVQRPTHDDLVKVVHELQRLVDKWKDSQQISELNIININEDLRTYNNSMMSVKEDLKNNQQKLESFGKDLTTSQQNIQSVKEDFKINQRHIETVQDDLKITKQNVESVKDDLKITKQNVETVKDDLKITKQNVETVKDDLNITKQNVETVKDDLKITKQNVETVKDDLNITKQNVETVKDDLNITKQNVETVKDDLKITKQNVETVKDDLNITKQNVETVKDDLKITKQNVESVKDDLNITKQNVESVKDDLKITKQKVETVKDDLKITKQNVETVKDDLKITKQNVETVKDDLKLTKQNVETVKDDLKLTKQNVESVKDDLKLTKQNIETVKDDLKITKQNVESVKDDLKITKQNIETVKDDLKITKQSVESVNKDMKMNQQNMDTFKQDIESVKESFKSSQQNIQRWTQTIYSLSANLSEFQSKVINLIYEGKTNYTFLHKPLSSLLPESCRNVISTKDREVVTLASGLKVMCDTKTEGGGWTIFQRRINGNVDFYRGWKEYRDGFGDYDIGEFYLGNENVFKLTSSKKYDLRIDLEFNNTKYFALYTRFEILGEQDYYKLQIGGYSGNAGDSLTTNHNDMFFSTYDKDNDMATSSNCAEYWKGAWWHNACFDSSLNVKWGSNKINWATLTGNDKSVTFTEMKIREFRLAAKIKSTK